MTLEDHRRQYDPAAARERLEREVRATLQVPERQPKPVHVHAYSRFTFTCSCGKHGRAW